MDRSSSTTTTRPREARPVQLAWTSPDRLRPGARPGRCVPPRGRGSALAVVVELPFDPVQRRSTRRAAVSEPPAAVSRCDRGGRGGGRGPARCPRPDPPAAADQQQHPDHDDPARSRAACSPRSPCACTSCTSLRSSASSSSRSGRACTRSSSRSASAANPASRARSALASSQTVEPRVLGVAVDPRRHPVDPREHRREPLGAHRTRAVISRAVIIVGFSSANAVPLPASSSPAVAADAAIHRADRFMISPRSGRPGGRRRTARQCRPPVSRPFGECSDQVRPVPCPAGTPARPAGARRSNRRAPGRCDHNRTGRIAPSLLPCR